MCAYGLLIPEELLRERKWLNVHPSLLPRWRGAAPVERAILAGDAETGVTIHETVKELDAGPIAAQRSFPIGDEDDAATVFERAARVAVELLDDVLADVSPHFVPQATEGVTYAEKISGRRPQCSTSTTTRSSSSVAFEPFRLTSAHAPSFTAGR